MGEFLKEPSRRSFLDWLLNIGLIAWVISVLYPVFEYLKVPSQAESVPNTVLAANLKDLANNQGVIFRFGNSPAILIRTREGDLKAFSANCTHLECTVQYRPDLQRIWCACHNGIYDLNGRNIAGPPPRPLEDYSVVVKGDSVFVSKA